MDNEHAEILKIAEEYRLTPFAKSIAPKDILLRWNYAHDQITNHFKYGKELENLICQKFNVSAVTAKLDIKNAKQNFISEDEVLMNIDYYRMLLFNWQLKGVALAYKNDQIKEFNSGIKNLYMILGLNKAVDGPDPRNFKDQIVNHFHFDSKKFDYAKIDAEEVESFIDEIVELSAHEKLKLKRDAKFAE